jgi:uncharacterized protein YecE (DUF72 family)
MISPRNEHGGGGQIRVGISGWTHKPWRGKFFPQDLPQRRELEYASRQVNSIEVNGMFYSLQRPEYFRAWSAAVPEDFVFSIKGGRFITHIKRLKEVERPLANFLASGPLELGHKLGPFLWQLPPNFVYDRGRLEHFFRLLPRDTLAAAELAQQHDAKVAGRASVFLPKVAAPLRHGLEVRHRWFETAEFIELLREHRIALVVADAAGKWPFHEEVTADFVYIRLHGAEELYVSGYTPGELDRWARKIKRWASGGTPRGTSRLTRPPPAQSAGRDVFVYFDNDAKVFAPFDAMSLARRLGLSAPQALPEERR